MYPFLYLSLACSTRGSVWWNRLALKRSVVLCNSHPKRLQICKAPENMIVVHDYFITMSERMAFSWDDVQNVGFLKRPVTKIAVVELIWNKQPVWIVLCRFTYSSFIKHTPVFSVGVVGVLSFLKVITVKLKKKRFNLIIIHLLDFLNTPFV